MAYGLLLYKELETPQGKQRLEIYKDGYTGTAIEIAGLHKDGITISKDSQNMAQAITTSVLTIGLSDCGEIDYSQLFTPNATLFKVVWKTKVGSAEWETRWTGFITPDSYTENLAYRDTLTLTARDNLGRLNDYDFSLEKGQMLSVRSIINAGLAVAGVAMNVTYTTTKVATQPTTVLAIDGLVNTSLLVGRSWYDAVSLLLTGLGMTLAWNDGNAFEVRDISQAPASSQSAFFIGKSGYRQIRPAWKNLTIAQDYGLRDSFYEGQFTKEDCGGAGRDHTEFTPPSGSKWSTTGSVTLMNPYNGTQTPLETIFMPLGTADTITDALVYSQNVPAMDRTVTIGMQLNNTLWYTYETQRRFGIGFNGYTHQSTEHLDGYTMMFRFNVFLTYGNTKYVLRENWEVYDPTDTEDPYLYFYMPWTRDGVNQYIDASISMNSIPEDGVLEFAVYKPLVFPLNGTKKNSQPITPGTGFDWYGRINEITMSIGESVDGVTDLIDINAVHNVQESLSLAVGQVPASRGGFLLYYGGLFYDDSYRTVLAEFKRSSSDETDYPLLELVAREYITYNNDNYDLLSGQMMTDGAAFRFDKDIAYGDTDFRIIGAALNILGNVLSVTSMQVEAEFTEEDYTITAVDSEGNYSSGGSYAGGAAQGGGGGSASDPFFEAIKDPGTSVTTGAKALYDLYIIQTPAGSGSGSGSGEETKNITEILKHLRLQTVDGALAMICDITLVTDAEAVAGGIGGGGGGGSTTLAGLEDVSLTTLSSGQSLVWNGTAWTNTRQALGDLSNVVLTSPTSGQMLAFNGTNWVNRNFALNELSDVSNVQATDGQALVYDYSNQIWKPGTVATSVTSADADIGTTLTTIATIGGTAIKAKITHQSLSGYATENWVTGTALYGYATQSWVTSLGYITSSALNGYATESWVNGRGFLTSVPVADSSTVGGIKLGFTTSAQDRNYAVQLSSNRAYVNVPWTEYTHPSGGANTTITEANGRVLSAITVDAYGHTTYVASKTLAAADMPDLSGYYLPLTGGTLTGDLTLGSSGSTGKRVTIYGATNSAALRIWGGSSYSTDIYRQSSYLYISSAVYVNADFTVNGNEYVTGESAAGTASDRRLKKNIETLAFGAAARVLAKLRPVTFDWNAKAKALSEGRKSGHSRGFIADEYNSIIEGATRKIWGEYDAIEYEAVIPYLVAGWQLHESEVAALRTELKELRRENETLKRRLQ